MERFHLAVALGPMAIYLILVATIRLRRHPFVTTGGRDVAALALGMMGMVAVGPMELFFPQQAAAALGPWVWGLLFTFYWLCITLWALTARKRIIVYGLPETELREMLMAAGTKFDSAATWNGDTLVFPSSSIQAVVEMSGNRTVGQILSIGERQNLENWWRLESEMVKEAKSRRNRYRAVGYPLLIGGLLLVAVSIGSVLGDLEVSLQAMRTMLRW